MNRWSRWNTQSCGPHALVDLTQPAVPVCALSLLRPSCLVPVSPSGTRHAHSRSSSRVIGRCQLPRSGPFVTRAVRRAQFGCGTIHVSITVATLAVSAVDERMTPQEQPDNSGNADTHHIQLQRRQRFSVNNRQQPRMHSRPVSASQLLRSARSLSVFRTEQRCAMAVQCTPTGPHYGVTGGSVALARLLLLLMVQPAPCSLRRLLSAVRRCSVSSCRRVIRCFAVGCDLVQDVQHHLRQCAQLQVDALS